MEDRSIFELWLIVQSNFERIYDGFKEQKGLCNVINVLLDEDLITWSETLILKRIINDYKKTRNIDIFTLYIWPKDERKPRRLFIQKQILQEIRKTN